MTYIKPVLLRAFALLLFTASSVVNAELITATVDWSSSCSAGSQHTTSDCAFSIQYDNSGTKASLYKDGDNGTGEFGYGDDVWVSDVNISGARFLSQGIADLSGFYKVVESQIRAENPTTTSLHNFLHIDSALLIDTHSYVYEDSTGLNFHFKKDSFTFDFNFTTLKGNYEVANEIGDAVLDHNLVLDLRNTITTYQGELIYSPAPGEPPPPPSTLPDTNPPSPVAEPETPITTASAPPALGFLLLAVGLISVGRKYQSGLLAKQ